MTIITLFTLTQSPLDHSTHQRQAVGPPSSHSFRDIHKLNRLDNFRVAHLSPTHPLPSPPCNNEFYIDPDSAWHGRRPRSSDTTKRAALLFGVYPHHHSLTTNDDDDATTLECADSNLFRPVIDESSSKHCTQQMRHIPMLK